ncbi:ZIP family metal transporter [Halomonas sp. FeN2]|uniref:ZIP family metal transporter n=1 Tax=Halomonas sp. FeN2 TaxID=2832500 RepID=UPI000C6790EC|nr:MULTISPECIES: ZIP family metal transporter [unclassified Halomonas]MBF60254.1 divalent cation transporter [Halomonas sp.]UBR48549.1 ZIP family metal transporter [Halomonas sp. FeN2]|tara:strand:+ start:459 stop:1166 length:708 start_codon:yes stop_codon:yes gene_type:complete
MSVYGMLFIAWGAGLMALFGGFLAHVEGTANTIAKQELVHGITAFGGGILVAAVAFALVPEGMHELNTRQLTGLFAAGGVTFCVLDAWLQNNEGNVAQFMAMLLDFVPEAVSLGAVFAANPQMGVLLALFIAAQNFPEGFNAYRELRAAKLTTKTALWGLLGVSFFGPLSAIMGYWWLSEAPQITAMIMSFAAGGILYLVFQDIAPQARMRRHWTPSLGAVLGFIIGMLSKQLLG